MDTRLEPAQFLGDAQKKTNPKARSSRRKDDHKRRLRLLFLPVHALRPEQSFIHAVQALSHAGPQQLVVVDLKKVVHDEPDGLLSGHPLQMIEAGEVYGARKGTHGSLPSQVEIEVEVAHGQFAQGAVDR